MTRLKPRACEPHDLSFGLVALALVYVVLLMCRGNSWKILAIPGRPRWKIVGQVGQPNFYILFFGGFGAQGARDTPEAKGL